MQQPSPRQPFRPPPPDEFFGAPKQVWIIAGVLAFVLALSYLGYLVWDKSRELDQAKAANAAIREAAAKQESEAKALKDKLAENEALAAVRIAELQKEKEVTVQSHKSLEDELRAALESKDVTISQLQGKLTVNILDRILFESGEAVLKPDGEAVLRKIAAILTQHPTLKIHVIGHTDNIPVRPGSRSRFASNWELSAGRAIAAVRFLSEKGGVNPSQLGALGYGEFRPIADNSTAAGRARNRRIAITVLSEELAGSDAVKTVAPLTPILTNAPALSPGSALPPPEQVTNTLSEPDDITPDTTAPAKD